MNNFIPSVESCKISTENMSRLAIEKRDENHYRFHNILNKPDSTDFSKCDDNIMEIEERLVRSHNLLKGTKITNKNCHYTPFRSSSDQWVNQFSNPVFDNKPFNIQTKNRFKSN